MNQGVEYLKSVGVEVETAIENMVDLETYNEMLEEFYNSIDEEFQKIDEFKQKGDMPNYAILVHAMKSNARSFGFMNFGEMCYEHEIKSKANDINYVNENYDVLIQEKNKTKQIIENYRTL